MSNNVQQILNYHPFQIINMSGFYVVQVGYVVDVVSGELNTVSGAEFDIRYGEKNQEFIDGDSIFIKITHSDTSSFDFGDYAIIEDVSLSNSDESSKTVTSVMIGSIENGIINQRLFSDFYFFRGKPYEES